MHVSSLPLDYMVLISVKVLVCIFSWLQSSILVSQCLVQLQLLDEPVLLSFSTIR